VLEFGSTNAVHAPMAEALALIKRYKADVPGRVNCYAPGEHVPVDGIIPAKPAELMYGGTTLGALHERRWRLAHEKTEI
jgi:hypothetical protein